MKLVPTMSLIGGVALLLSVIAEAATTTSDYTVEQLLEPCVEGDNDSRWGAAAEAECEQYILGFTDAYIMLADAEGVCLPALNRADEVRWAFMKWAHRHFDQRGMPAAEGLLAVVRSEFACE